MRRVMAFVLLLCVALGVVAIGQSVVQTGSVQTFFNKGGDNLRAEICDFIKETTTRLDVAIYDLTDSEIIQALADHTDATHDIRLIVSTEGGGGKLETDACALLFACGVQVKRISNMHHKFAVCGPRVLTGSTNWTLNSIETEANNLLVINSLNIANSYETEFKRLWGKATPFRQ